MLNTRIIVTEYGGPEVLELIQEPLRTPARGEVRVKVQSAGVALGDIMRREGLFPTPPPTPFTPGYDVVGIVDELGENVGEFSIGEKVAVFFDGTGGYSQYVYAKAEELVAVPAHIDAAEAVAVILNYVTAYQMLHRIAKISEGDRILVHGASGGVGTALLELGRLAKLTMYGTASLAKHRIVSQYGAVPVDYRNEDFVEVLRDLAPHGMDAVFDPIGGRNWERSIQTLNGSGRFVGYGYTSVLQDGNMNDWVHDWERLATRSTTGTGNSQYLYTITGLKREKPNWFREDLQSLFSLLEEGTINPMISHRIPLREAADAQELLKNGLSTGKVVLIC